MLPNKVLKYLSKALSVYVFMSCYLEAESSSAFDYKNDSSNVKAVYKVAKGMLLL